jgi:2-polyprenyl-6-methoxyphenol hydroxylase-like FAD-dependent oxidoreductase
MSKSVSADRAIVIGASIGGLLAARALAFRFREVIIVERDTLPHDAVHRKGVPQAHHSHGILARGLEIFELLFPGITQTLYDQGAVHGDVGETVRWFHHGRYHPAVAVDLEGMAVSRLRLESAIRERVRALPTVRIVDGTRVAGLVGDAEHGCVRGVHCLDAQDLPSELLADLVVDCSGRGSRVPAWLQQMGFDAPAESRVPIDLGYATRLYTRKRGDPRIDTAYIIASSPPAVETGVLLWQEGGQFMVTLGGYFGDHPPTDDAAFLAFARRLPVPELADLIATSEPASSTTSFRYPASVRRHYERLRRFPEGLLLFGDAICSFNPIYGQGMTACGMQALELERCALLPPAQRWRTFFKAASAVLETPWRLAVGNDLRFEQIDAPRSLDTRFVNWYVRQVHAAVHHDDSLVREFLRVVNLVAPPTRLFAPRVVWSVLRGAVLARRS